VLRGSFILDYATHYVPEKSPCPLFKGELILLAIGIIEQKKNITLSGITFFEKINRTDRKKLANSHQPYKSRKIKNLE
jgi:hypothetical protein